MKKLLFAIATSFTCTIALSQNVGIGTTTPVEKLDVSGNIKTTGEIKPNGIAGQTGQVLTSNGNGTMQWAQAKAAGGSTNGNGGWGDCSIYNIDSLQIAANNIAVPGRYGDAVSLSGNYAIVGAPDDGENSLAYTGSATILEFNPATGQWDTRQKLTNANPAMYDAFGHAVAISGNYAIVGSFMDSEGGLGNCGSATIFKRNSSTGIWENQAKLLNPNAASSDYFGMSVAISGDYVVVGASGDQEAGFLNTGSATIFKRNSTSGVWESQGKIINPSAAYGDGFGTSVSISGNYIVVGAPYDDEPGKSDCGSITFFKRNTVSGIWESQGKFLKPGANGTDQMGISVSISGDYAIAGAQYHYEGTTPTYNGGAFIYKRNTTSGVWEYQDRLLNPLGQNNDFFGSSVSIAGDYAIVGAVEDDENGLIDNGSATIFKRIETIWYPHQKFSYPATYYGNNTRFGTSLSINDNQRFVVGAPELFSRKGMVFFGTAK